MISKILILGSGGAFGTLCRFFLSTFTQKTLGSGFSWGTASVNIVGCFLIGLAWSLSIERSVLSPSGRLFFMVGFLGAFTTFSTYALESINFLREREISILLFNIILNNLIGFMMVILGMWLGRLL
ncbi:MAG: fluoride efflux transporter CrcB [Nitrospirae bacterium]|nr:MAG: fluoride efflux transporter CrcB [Nitrospirota bacterium]